MGNGVKIALRNECEDLFLFSVAFLLMNLPNSVNNGNRGSEFRLLMLFCCPESVDNEEQGKDHVAK